MTDTTKLAEAFGIIGRAFLQAAELLGAPPSVRIPKTKHRFRLDESPQPEPEASERRESKPTPLPVDDGAETDASPMRRTILIALAQFARPMSTRQIGLYSGKAHKGGAFVKALASLRADGCVEGGGAALTITQAGFAELGDWARLPEGSQLFQFWCSKLGTMAEQILRALRKHGGPMTPEQIGEATQKAHKGGAFVNALAQLKRMELVTGGTRAGIDLSPDLKRALDPMVRVYDTSSGQSVRVDARKGHTR